MKKLIKEGFKLFGIAATLSFVVLVGIYFYQTNVAASSTDFIAVIETVSSIEETTIVEDQEDENTTLSDVQEVVEIGTEEVTTEEETTEDAEEVTIEVTAENTEAETATTEAETTTVAETTTTAAATTEAATTEAATSEAPTQTPTQAVVQTVTYTNVTYSDVNGNKTTYATLEDFINSVSIATLTDAQANATAIQNKTTYAAYAQELLEDINAYRAANGLSALTYNDNLATAAMHRAAENAYSNWNVTAYENGVTKRHIRPNYEKASTIASYYGITGSFGENFGRFFSTPDSILAGWEASSAHNALLLSTSYSEIGIGVAQASNGDYYWIALFN